MFKRANKITSLLVAAAAVASLVPVTGVYAADAKKVDSQDGTIYNAVAFKDGKALVDGEINSTDAAYYLADGKYTALDDIDSGSTYTTYGTKYADVDTGDYFVDLETGKSTDEDVKGDDSDDAASALRKKIKDSDRYANATPGKVTINGSSVTVYGDNDLVDDADLALIPGSKFADNWYSTYYAPDGTKNVGDNGQTYTNYNILTDAKGNYIDADYNLGKIRVSTTGSSAKSVEIENTKDNYDLLGTGDVYAKITSSRVLGQDASNIYRYATIAVTAPSNSSGILINNEQLTTDGTKNGPKYTGGSTITLDVIQKISKAQDSDEIDDAKYAKTVTNYMLADENGANDQGDAAKFNKLIKTGNAFSTDTVDAKVTVIGGKLVAYAVDNSKAASSNDNVIVQAVTLKSKNGFYYTDAEEQQSNQAEYNDDLAKAAFDVDADGNIYILDSGYVKEFDGTSDYNKIYKVDGSFNDLSVYDKDNIVAWSQGDEVYSIIGGKDATGTDTTGTDTTGTDTTGTTTPTTPVVTASGWVQAADKTWTFVKADGTKATGWYQDGATWYYLDPTSGVMATGWKQVGSTWYYLNASGAMLTGWVQDGSTWYYCDSTGAMLANTVVDGYTLGASGAWVQ